MIATRKRARGVSAQQHQAIEAWAGKVSAAEIRKELERLGLVDANDRPDRRTIQRIVRDLDTPPEKRATDAWRRAHEPWQLSSDPEHAAIVLRVMAGVLSGGGGTAMFGQPALRLDWPTVGQSEWIVRLHTAAPDLIEQHPWGWFELYMSAAVYQARAERGATTTELDAYLALAPWRDGGALYTAAVRRGTVPQIHAGFHWMALADLAPGATSDEDRPPNSTIFSGGST